MQDDLDSPAVFTLCVEDLQGVAMMKLGRELTEDELYWVKKGVEWGLDCWSDVVGYAIDDLKHLREEGRL